MSACSTMTPPRAPAGVYGSATVYKEGDLRQQIMKRVVKGKIDKDPERKGYGVFVRIDKIRGYSGFNIVQERQKQG